MGGLFGGGGGGPKKVGTTTPSTETRGGTTAPAPTNASTPIPPEARLPATLAAGPTPEMNRRRPSFLVTPTMIDDAYGDMTGRRETFG